MEKEPSDIVDLIPPDASPALAAIPACYRCVTDLGSNVPLKDMLQCRSQDCAVWPSLQRLKTEIRNS